VLCKIHVIIAWLYAQGFFYFKMIQIPDWLKTKGYLHLSPSLKIGENWRVYKRQIENKDFVSKYAFYPLIHSFILERKYKNADSIKHSTAGRAHKHKHKTTNDTEKTAKSRPLHYASHYDALVYGYYAELLNHKYEEKLSQIPRLSDSVTAYRKLKIEEGLDNSTTRSQF
jgi:hypothetical protein